MLQPHATHKRSCNQGAVSAKHISSACTSTVCEACAHVRHVCLGSRILGFWSTARVFGITHIWFLVDATPCRGRSWPGKHTWATAFYFLINFFRRGVAVKKDRHFLWVLHTPMVNELRCIRLQFNVSVLLYKSHDIFASLCLSYTCACTHVFIHSEQCVLYTHSSPLLRFLLCHRTAKNKLFFL